MNQWGSELANFRIVALCLNKLRYFSLNCLREKEIPFSSATEISIAMCTGSPKTSVLGRCMQILTSCLIPLRSILILSSLLRKLPPSGAYAVGSADKVLFIYFLTAMRATDSSLLFFDTTKCAVRHPLH